jgi:hypothetical protein
MKNIVVTVLGVLGTLPLKYCESTWVTGGRLLKSLVRSRVDRARCTALIDAGEGNVRALATFLPQDDGYARLPVYDRFKSVTGRLSIVSGPDILTLKREHRNVLVPSDRDMSLLYVDFAALEARVVLYEAGGHCERDDLYEELGREIGFPRDAVKHAVISMLYGSSQESLRETLTGMSSEELSVFIKRVKTVFGVKELLTRVKKRFLDEGFVFNRYGRPIKIEQPQDRLLVNYYAQSTGVDVSLLGFHSLLKTFEDKGLGVRPLFLLHDALVIEVPTKNVSSVKRVKTVTVPGYVQKFVLKTTEL